MDISNHNIRALIASADFVSQNAKGELNHGMPNVPDHKSSGQAGDVDKVIKSGESEKSKNDLKEKQRKESSQRGKNDAEDEEDDLQKSPPVSHPNLGIKLDINA